MHVLTEHNILFFLIQLGILLGLARGLGEIFRKFGQPSITAEILVGVILGPSILGRWMPEFQSFIFPMDPIQLSMIETVAWLGILFFLLNAGLETNLATALRQIHHAAMLSLCDLTIPMIIAFLPALLIPARYIGEDVNIVTFALFLAAIMTISALPVTARVMQDIKVYRTDLGLLIMSALTINDVAGWVVFALILGFFSGTVVSGWGVAFILGATLVYAGISLSVGPKLFNGALGKLEKWNVSEPAGSLTLLCLVGLFGGAVTTWIGIHSLFGFFIAGIMAGEASRLSERTRHIFSQMVRAILVPLFFASIGLKVDFIGQFDLFLVLFILVIGVSGRYLAGYIGSRVIGQPKLHSRFIANAHIPGGEMQIVIGMVALEAGVISEAVYVAIIFGAVITSIISGPILGGLLKKIQKKDWLAYLPVDNILTDVTADNKKDAIIELCAVAAKSTEQFDKETIQEAVLDREQTATTALDGGVAVPHARFAGLERAIVIFARSKSCIEWDARDGKPVQLIFLVLTPEEEPESQLQILRGLATAVTNDKIRNSLISSKDAGQAVMLMRKAKREATKKNLKTRRRFQKK